MGIGKRGPTVGNAGNPTKRKEFIAEKESYSAVAREIAGAIGARAGKPDVPPVSHQKNQGMVSGDVNKGKGPRKGNK